MFVFCYTRKNCTGFGNFFWYYVQIAEKYCSGRVLMVIFITLCEVDQEAKEQKWHKARISTGVSLLYKIRKSLLNTTFKLGLFKVSMFQNNSDVCYILSNFYNYYSANYLNNFNYFHARTVVRDLFGLHSNFSIKHFYCVVRNCMKYQKFVRGIQLLSALCFCIYLHLQNCTPSFILFFFLQSQRITIVENRRTI